MAAAISGASECWICAMIFVGNLFVIPIIKRTLILYVRMYERQRDMERNVAFIAYGMQNCKSSTTSVENDK